MLTPPAPLLADLRKEYHRALQARLWGWDGGEASNADKGSAPSKSIARQMLAGTSATTKPAKNQTAGVVFTTLTREFIEKAFSRLGHIRPGSWKYSTAQGIAGITAYAQYRHLATIRRVLEEHRGDREFRTAFATDYLVVPDIVIGRSPLTDEEINAQGPYVGEEDVIARRSPLRATNEGSQAILHASISCKWTIRSDRAQNTRTEALNLLRNRKGNAPHIVAVTGEPLPARLASLALGTGDLDCVYHMALYELQDALKTLDEEAHLEMLDILVEGNRLRDISDLPLDLAV